MQLFGRNVSGSGAARLGAGPTARHRGVLLPPGPPRKKTLILLFYVSWVIFLPFGVILGPFWAPYKLGRNRPKLVRNHPKLSRIHPKLVRNHLWGFASS